MNKVWRVLAAVCVMLLAMPAFAAGLTPGAFDMPAALSVAVGPDHDAQGNPVVPMPETSGTIVADSCCSGVEPVTPVDHHPVTAYTGTAHDGGMTYTRDIAATG